MHEFKLTIKLDNKDYCNGCQLLSIPYHSCVRYSVFIDQDVRIQSKNFGGYIRPDICKESEVTNG